MNWVTIRYIDTYIGIPFLYVMALLRRAFRRHATTVIGPRPRILLVKFWGIGNIFMMLPSVGALRQTFPDGEIEILTLETNRTAAECSRVFSAIHTVDTSGYLRFLRMTISALMTLRRRHYDIIIDFEQFARYSAIIVALIGRNITVGFNTAFQYRHFLFSHPVVYDNNIHVTRSYCSLVQAAGTDVGNGSGPCTLSEFALPDRNASAMMNRLGIRTDRIMVTMHVGTSSNFSERRWPAAYYAVLADLLIKNHGAQIILSGLADEKKIAAEVAEQTRFRDCVVDACGELSFEEYFDLIRSSDLVISVDTAAVHIASAAGTPVVGLYGPNTPALYGPWGPGGISFYRDPDCSPCITNFNAKTHDCRHREGKGACMRRIKPEEVYREICSHYFDEASPLLLRKSGGDVPCSR